MILIDMDMPKCCQDCPIYDHEFGCCNLIPNSRYYDNDGVEYYDPFEERNKGCPLRECKEGKWIEKIRERDMLCPDGRYWVCSACNTMQTYGHGSNFCMNCGAKIIGTEIQHG